jgi:hypothetical protein
MGRKGGRVLLLVWHPFLALCVWCHEFRAVECKDKMSELGVSFSYIYTT